MNALFFTILQIIAKIRAMPFPFGKKMADRVADAILDVLEEWALTTESTLDDRALAWIRARLNIPEFEPTPITPLPPYDDRTKQPDPVGPGGAPTPAPPTHDSLLQ